MVGAGPAALARLQPAAAAATLRNRAASADTSTARRRTRSAAAMVLDLVDDESAEGIDVVPGADAEDERTSHERPTAGGCWTGARGGGARAATRTRSSQRAIALVKELLTTAISPIVFCRFIPTAEYVADALAPTLKRTSRSRRSPALPPAEREARVRRARRGTTKRVLVATDCLRRASTSRSTSTPSCTTTSPGTPPATSSARAASTATASSRDAVRVAHLLRRDNQIDGIVLDVLLRKHQRIRNSLGISVPGAGGLERRHRGDHRGPAPARAATSSCSLLDEPDSSPSATRFHDEWDRAADREKRSRTVFAQETIKPDEVARELEAVARRDRLGRRRRALRPRRPRAHGATLSGRDPIDDRPRRDARARCATQLGLGDATSVRARFELPVPDGVIYLSRTHPLVEGLAGYVVDTALDPQLDGVASAPASMRTKAVETRTTAAPRPHPLRRRHPPAGEEDTPDRRGVARRSPSTGAPENAGWLGEEKPRRCSTPSPTGTSTPEQAAEFSRVDRRPRRARPAPRRGRRASARPSSTTPTSASARAPA